MNKTLIYVTAAAAMVGATFWLYKRGQKRIAACCPPGVTQGLCYQKVGGGFFQLVKHGMGSVNVPIPSGYCTAQQLASAGQTVVSRYV